MGNADLARLSLACSSAISYVMSFRPSAFTSAVSNGVCGACTILVDGIAVRSCTQYAAQADGTDIVTVEGLAQPGALNEVQRAFAKYHALQCGFCTPGILCSVTHFLRETPEPDEQQVREMLSGHICRCTGYASIVAAILEAAAMMSKGS